MTIRAAALSRRRIAIARAHFPVTTLGYGRRVGIWTQGCTIRCCGCMSTDTWPRLRGDMVEVGNLVQSLRPWLATADGVTVSGGEPFEQPAALAALLRILRLEISGDLFVYSGMTWERLVAEYPDVVGLPDVIMSEPYDASITGTLPFRGSDNQRLHRLTPLGALRYPESFDEPVEGVRSLDVATVGETAFLVGIPMDGARPNFRRRLRDDGFAIESVRTIRPDPGVEP